MASRNDRKPLEPPAHAPGFRLPQLDGGEVSLGEILKQAPLLLAFFKVNCPVCQLAFPFLERLYKPGHLPVYGISQNGRPDTREFARRYAVTFPMLLDLESAGYPASNAYGLTNVPTIFLVESDGTIAQTIHGWNKKQMMEIGAANGVQVVLPGENVPEWKAG